MLGRSHGVSHETRVGYDLDMPELQERLDAAAHVRGSLIKSHLAWAEENLREARPTLARALETEHRELVERTVLSSAWVPFTSAVAVDKAIAALVGGDPLAVYEILGRASAQQNLTGPYRFYQAEDPHRFFSNTATLHEHFQDFGRAEYRTAGERSGRFTIRDCTAYSPVHCAGERGYLAEALVVLGVAGTPAVAETACRCRGDACCVFEIAW